MQPVLTHLALHVRDLDACVEFYREFCAMGVVHERGGGDGRVVWLAEPGREAGCLMWEPRDDAYPVGYYCGVRDPDGTCVEFSYGQPLGPGAPAD